MSRLNRALGRFDWVGRFDTAFGLVSVAGAAVGGFAAYLSDWSTAGVILATFSAGAAISIAYIAWTIFWDRWDAVHHQIILSAAPIFKAQEGLFPAKYIQVAVRAKGDLVGCQVILREIARVDDGSDRIVYSQPLNAAWSGLPGTAIDIHDGQELHANLFSVSRVVSFEKYFLIPRTYHSDEALRLAVHQKGQYRLTVVASAKAALPQKKKFMLRWGDSFDDIEFWEPADG